MFIALHLLLIASPPQELPCVPALDRLPLCEDDGRRRGAIASLQRDRVSDVQEEPPMQQEKAAAPDAANDIDVKIKIRPRSSDKDTDVWITPQGKTPDKRSVSELEKRKGYRILALPPGSYDITVKRDRFAPLGQALSIEQGREPDSIDFRLKLLPAAKKRRDWALGWGLTGAALAGAGIGVVAVAGRNSRNLLESSPQGEAEIDGRRKDLAQATMLRAGGAGMLGAGLGWVVSGPFSLAGERARKIGWVAEAGVGGAFVVAGLIFLRVTRVSFNQVNTSVASGLPTWGPEFEELLKPGMRGYVAAAALLGAGLGLGISSVFGLLRFREGSDTSARMRVLPDGFEVKF